MTSARKAYLDFLAGNLPYDTSNQAVLDLIEDIRRRPAAEAVDLLTRLAHTLLERTEHARN